MTLPPSSGYAVARGEVPIVVRAARALMVAGGVSHLAALAITVGDSAQNTLDQSVVAAGVVEMGVVGTLWWMMAAKCYAGRRWARATTSALFALFVVSVVVRRGAGVGISWVTVGIGLAAVVLLWTPAASRYFRRRYGLDRNRAS